MDGLFLISDRDRRGGGGWGVGTANDKNNHVMFSLMSIKQAVSTPVDVSTFEMIALVSYLNEAHTRAHFTLHQLSTLVSLRGFIDLRPRHTVHENISNPGNRKHKGRPMQIHFGISDLNVKFTTQESS